MNNIQNLAEVIIVDEDKCVNCHACIAACPVKYCNNAIGDSVNVNTNMCIACGHCIDACLHDARYSKDDFDKFTTDLKNKENIIAIVTPSVAASFPDKYLNLNTWLKKMGVKAVFDVSFGAELTVKSYLNHINEKQPEIVISQPCAALVTYVQLYQPELIKHLAPVDSPIIHTIKMVKEFYKQYSDHKMAIISPCNAKKREFEQTGYGDYNVGHKSIDAYLNEHNIDLSDFPESDFDNPSAERAVVFSSPGGLLSTVERTNPEIKQKTRVTEGVPKVYDYFKHLPETIDKKINPLLVDCLSCEYGCNAGPLTLAKHKSVDEIEYWVDKRKDELQKRYSEKNNGNEKLGLNEIHITIDKYWKEGLYNRSYTNLFENIELKYPTKEETDLIYKEMHKYTQDDIRNCNSCGYGRCEYMATAIFNNLNKAENCHFYLQTETITSHEEVIKSKEQFSTILKTSLDGFIKINTNNTITDANPAIVSILKKKDIIGRNLNEFLDTENQKIQEQECEKRKNNVKNSYELVFTQSDGGKVICMVSAAPLFSESNEFQGSFAMIKDISKLKKAEQELRDANEHLEQKVSERTVELRETLNEVNTHKEELLTVNEDLNQQKEEIQTTLEKLQSTQNQLVQSEKMAALGVLIAGVAHEVNTPLGAIKSSADEIAIAFQENLKEMPTFLRNLNDTHFSAFMHLLNKANNNTESLSTREERKLKRHIRELFENHELENANYLASCMVQIGISDLTNDEIAFIKNNDPEKLTTILYNLVIQNKNNENVRLAANKAARVILALKNYSRTENNGTIGPVNVAENINTVLIIYQNQLKKGITVIKEFDEIPEVNAYSDKLSQIWTNLIQNALQVMKYSGTLTISLKNNIENNKVIVGIGDSGTGIPENIQDKVFDAFFTTKPAGEGSGLGLDIVKKIVDDHNGHIYFETEKDKGTTFYVELPVILN